MEYVIIFALLGILVGVFVGYFVMKKSNESKMAGARNSAEQVIEDAKREAEALKKEALLEAKDENHKLRTETES